MGLEATRHIGRIVIHPKNPDVVYVAALGHLWGANPERGVYKTSDGGKSWSQVLKINDDTGVSDIALDPESPDTVYAAAYQRRRTPYGFNGGGPDSAIYKTTDAGATWKKLTKGLPYENGGETGRIGLDIYRKDPNIVYAIVQHEKGGTYRSEDKGEAWKKMSDTNPRPSYYSQVRIDPNNDLRVWALGAQMFYSEDGGKTFSTQRVRGIHGDYHAMWIDPADSNHMITGSDGGIQWNSAVAVSAHNHTTVYYGGNYLFKSTDRGDTWTRLGGDLTTGVDRNKLQIFGKTPDKNTLSRHDGVQEYPTITTFSESPLTPSVLWVGTDDGNLQVTRDGGKTWKNVAPKVPGVPKGTYASRVVAWKTGDGVAFVTFDGHRGDDYNVYIFATNDYGESWKAIRNGIPDSAGSVHVMREHPRNTNLLFAGAEFGLWASWDRGANWMALKNNFPTVPVDDIEIQARENDLVLATHGRSIWILDDLTPIEKMDANAAASSLTFFPPRPAITWHLRNRRWSAGQKMFTAKNPPYGTILTYYLKEAVPAEAAKKSPDEKDKKDSAEQKPRADAKGDTVEKKEGKVKITVLDKDGKVIREMDGPGAAGVNRTNWDLRSNAPAEPTPEQLEAIAAGFGFGPRGPLVEPGEYTVKIKAGDKEDS